MTERLSDKNPCGTCQKSCSSDCECEERANYEYDCIKKLAEYETAEEEGRLVVLPCKLNETVYLLLNKNDFAEKIIKCRIREVSIGFCGVKLSLISEDSMIGHLDWYDVEEVGKEVFLTREEAEKVLKEMEGKHETSN